jgi:hypothetical protein
MQLLGTRCSIKTAVGTCALAVCLLVTAGQLAAAPRQAPSSDPDPIGKLAREETVLDAGTSSTLLAQAGETGNALGFPVGVKRIGKHVRDGFEQAEYDEVTELDSKGRISSITQFDKSGRLRTAIRLDSPPRGVLKVSGAGAIRLAQRSAQTAGLTLGTPSATDADQATGGWTVHWDRVAAGIRVRGDETRVQVWPDGRIQSVARVEHDLGPAPGQRINAESAKHAASDNLDRWFSGSHSGYAIQGVALEWVEPNGAFDPSLTANTSVPYRLAWVTEVKPSGDAANSMWLMTLFVDAGDGNIIGGDFVE